ncbi:MAG: CDGSH iron-sulfur domain-containing protein [Acidobacteriota bacterium]|nr:MAG: CDGSH iron-sulfur domain-containing protein [Acidobacteriota bacterium]
MSDPIVADTRPEVLELEPGRTYHWCRCGRSKDQPWCDGSHQGTGIEPIEFTVETHKNYALCKCKKTAESPFCDGTHSSL